MERVRLDLEDDEYSALICMSERELRPVAEQIRYVLRQTLKRRGLLASERVADCSPAGVPGGSVEPR